jgi:Uma2 family endonuclease
MVSEIKLELIDGFVMPFANGTLSHTLVCERVVRELTSAAKPNGLLFTSRMALRQTGAPTYVFPDASYTREVIAPDAECIIAPSLIVEVMSPQSVNRDRVDKFDAYIEIASLEEYLIVDSRRIWTCLCRRVGRSWKLTNYGRGDTIELTSIGKSALKTIDLYPEGQPPE